MSEYRDGTYIMIAILHVLVTALIILGFLSAYQAGNPQVVGLLFKIMLGFTLISVTATGILFIVGWADNRLN